MEINRGTEYLKETIKVLASEARKGETSVYETIFFLAGEDRLDLLSFAVEAFGFVKPPKTPVKSV